MNLWQLRMHLVEALAMRRAAVLLLLIWTVAGCSSNFGVVPVNHIVMINSEGHPVDPTENTGCWRGTGRTCEGDHSPFASYRELTPGQYSKQTASIVTSLHKYAENLNHTSARSGNDEVLKRPKILLYLHGGLNLQVDSVQRASKLYQSIKEDTGAYPIFINWQSSLFPSYWDHLVHIRQGENWNEGNWSSLGGYLTAPFVLAADLTRAVVRLPAVTFFQLRNDLETVPNFRAGLSLWSSDLALAQEAAFEALCRNNGTEAWDSTEALDQYKGILSKEGEKCEKLPGVHEMSNLHIWNGPDVRRLGSRSAAFVNYFLTLSTKLATAPILDTFGTSSWDAMLRSVSQLFHYDGQQRVHTQAAFDETEARSYTTGGALAYFLQGLDRAICGERRTGEPCLNKEGWEIALVAHSTGAIILNHIVRDFGELPIKNIVYMAAASSIKDYQDTIFPYLQKKNGGLEQGQSSVPTSAGVRGKLTEENEPSLISQADKPCGLGRVGQKEVCVYHLMLHEASESGEWNVLDLPPRGSLLVWLDSFLSHPLSTEDRTLGRFRNFISAVHHTPSGLRPYIHIVKFGAGENAYGPQKHGDFGQKLKFWKPECWDPPAAKQGPVTCYSPTGHF